MFVAVMEWLDTEPGERQRLGRLLLNTDYVVCVRPGPADLEEQDEEYCEVVLRGQDTVRVWGTYFEVCRTLGYKRPPGEPEGA